MKMLFAVGGVVRTLVFVGKLKASMGELKFRATWVDELNWILSRCGGGSIH